MYQDFGLGMPGSSKGSAHPESNPASQPGPVEKGTPTGGSDPSSFGYQALSYLKNTHPMFALASAITDAATGKTKGGFCGHQTPTGQGMALPQGLDQSALSGTEYNAPPPEAPPAEETPSYED